MTDNRLRSWAFKRPYCKPSAGFVLARSGAEALKLLNFAYGFCTDAKVYCAETNEQASQEYESDRPAPLEYLA